MAVHYCTVQPLTVRAKGHLLLPPPKTRACQEQDPASHVVWTASATVPKMGKKMVRELVKEQYQPHRSRTRTWSVDPSGYINSVRGAVACTIFPQRVREQPRNHRHGRKLFQNSRCRTCLALCEDGVFVTLNFMHKRSFLSLTGTHMHASSTLAPRVCFFCIAEWSLRCRVMCR